MASNGIPATTKRLIACCDGTWMDSDNGYEEPGLLTGEGTLQVPSNVTRISRCFKRRCSDGKLQIINYESGVGTGSNMLDSITGGAFGLGLSERMRETYSYLCANYTDGDEIILVGYSRGAFTVRSVAGMVGALGLLTREGVEHFYPIFKDMQHWMDDDYEDPFPNIPFPNKPKGKDAATVYRAQLEKLGYTRVRHDNGQGDLIKIKAVCVWDTVGSLGIPRWHDTSLSDKIEHAFQALALDETRPPFSPAVWERRPENRLTTDLRQVWFPGNHANCGGGWEDQGIANCTLAWMMDQLASVGVEFDLPSLERCFQQTADFYKASHAKAQKTKQKKKKGVPDKWAISPIFDNNHPFRPWGLGSINKPSSLLYKLSGQTVRTPGLYRPTDPKTKLDEARFLQDTNERIHSTVRIRLACQGLGLNDKTVWDCPSLLKSWKVKRTQEKYQDPVPFHPGWDPEGEEDDMGDPNGWSKGRWVWEYVGSEGNAPTDKRQRIMVEEPLGPYERHLLRLSAGSPNVFHFSDTKED
ncbi:uncharacterized protein NECHADRAFT_38858 [Fusarium vanettenii 77-13-4]|uniref:T6SS Phospholipase effector Tle1-like catalytic domain-containing protein n=1 Tax=Fusarium vanettenii (strain ATCC MYA-4622 / CBS 123669 / FGSC 9596 / NRRL 45880 / 77-13-4) TaxID=660122 RepID=C7YR03_FUSV7|nr:uncharacterized protein NECHADRAFT_38858 [Fusarium vanettenii 77-13-4]EEU46562.1 hypothetical protein NECHADRAFT_38858 [Fusarium vanettenii 77-13-4]